MIAIAAASILLAQTPELPPILTRAEWGAKPRLDGAKPHEIHTVTIHHTGVLSQPNRTLEDKLRGLQAFSQRVDKLASGKEKPAWPDIPYHYYISIDGRIGEGREWQFAGDTNTEYNPTGHLLIVVEGEFGQENPTRAQLRSLNHLTTWVCQRWSIPSWKIAGHQDHSSQTSCPGKALDAYLPVLRTYVRNRIELGNR